MFSRVQWHSQPPQSPKLGTQVCPPCVLFTPSSCSWALSAIGTLMGRIYSQAGHLAKRTACDHRPLTSNHLGGSAVQGPAPQKTTYFSRVLEPADSAPLVCCLWRWLGDALMWSEVAHWVRWFWGPLEKCRPKFSCHLCFTLGPPGRSYKAICRWLLLMPNLGPLSKKYGAHWGQMLHVWKILGKSEAWAKTGHS